jgi:hypothetical protein
VVGVEARVVVDGGRCVRTGDSPGPTVEAGASVVAEVGLGSVVLDAGSDDPPEPAAAPSPQPVTRTVQAPSATAPAPSLTRKLRIKGNVSSPSPCDGMGRHPDSDSVDAT